MKATFTICSNNYLAQAKTLGDSLLAYDPNGKFFIFVVDTASDKIDYSFFSAFEVIMIETIFKEDFDALWKKYDIIELNTCVKPSCFKYLFQEYPELTELFYIDPDIMFLGPLKKLENEFHENDVLLTPHVLKPIPIDQLRPSENLFLIYGIYNLGFVGLKRSENVAALLNWWEERTLKIGFNRPGEGTFVDQLCMNFVPVFFNRVKILKDHSYNTAPWNIHERLPIRKDAGRYILGDNSELCFYHFSNYKFSQPEAMSKIYNRVNFEKSPELEELYRLYQQRILRNKITEFSGISCTYAEEHRQYKRKHTPASRKFKTFLKNRLLAANRMYSKIFER